MSVTAVLAGFKESTNNYYQGLNIMSIRGIDLANVLEKNSHKDIHFVKIRVFIF